MHFKINTRKQIYSISNNKDNNINKDIEWTNMISATKIRNYLLNDPLLDWLSFYKIRNINDNPIKINNRNNNNNFIKLKSESSFTQFIMSQGIDFENEIFKILKNKYNIIQVAESYQAKNVNKYLQTIEYMKQGVELIYQGVLHDYDNNIFGCPDLLVRSDRINEIFKTNLSRDEILNKSTKLNTPFHYYVIDIKHSTLYLSSNGHNLLNCNSIPAYKGQLYIYNKILSNIQGYDSNKSFILGKKWMFTKNNITYTGNDFMEKLGIVNFKTYDNKYEEKVNNALEWIKIMRRDGHTWKLLPKPSRHELYPNMKNEKDGEWRKIKNELNNKISDITSIWMCGFNKRNIALKKNILTWKDKRCNSKNLKFKKSKTSITLDHILNINRQNKDTIRVNSLSNKDDWRYFGDDIMEFYLDYETINSNMGQCEINNDNINYNNNNIIFLIGLGYYKDNKWNFKKFLCKKNSKLEEENMIKHFWSSVNSLLVKYNKSEPIFIHWTKAEPISYKKLLSRHNNQFPQKKFYDLFDLFKNNNIVVKGALNFSLKSIAKAMYKNNLIRSTWEEGKCSNGLNAMLMAYKLYQNNISIIGNEPVMTEIINYNETDCKVLWDIFTYLRNNY